MPLTGKGKKILKAMTRPKSQGGYGAKKGKEVFYASIESGTITGVEKNPKPPVTPEVTKLTGDIWNRITPAERDRLGIKAGLDAEARDKRWIGLWGEQKRAVIREFKKEQVAIPKAKPTPKSVEKGIRLTVRPKTYRGEAGYTVKGKDTDLFFNQESQAREYVKRVKAGERSSDVLSDIWKIKQARSGYTIAELMRLHAKRSPLSRASDERLAHQVTIDANDPKARGWVADPGTADIRGIDTPSISKKERRITPKIPKLK